MNIIISHYDMKELMCDFNWLALLHYLLLAIIVVSQHSFFLHSSCSSTTVSSTWIFHCEMTAAEEGRGRGRGKREEPKGGGGEEGRTVRWGTRRER